jgi:hypothetical protein
MGDEEQAVILCNKSLSLWRDLGNKRGIAMALESVGQVAPQRRETSGRSGGFEERGARAEPDAT